MKNAIRKACEILAAVLCTWSLAAPANATCALTTVSSELGASSPMTIDPGGAVTQVLSTVRFAVQPRAETCYLEVWLADQSGVEIGADVVLGDLKIKAVQRDHNVPGSDIRRIVAYPPSSDSAIGEVASTISIRASRTWPLIPPQSGTAHLNFRYRWISETDANFWLSGTSPSVGSLAQYFTETMPMTYSMTVPLEFSADLPSGGDVAILNFGIIKLDKPMTTTADIKLRSNVSSTVTATSQNYGYLLNANTNKEKIAYTFFVQPDTGGECVLISAELGVATMPSVTLDPTTLVLKIGARMEGSPDVVGVAGTYRDTVALTITPNPPSSL